MLLVAVWSCWGLSVAMGEQIPVNEGLGWDGVRFSRMVEGGPESLRARELNSYYVQRVGPSFAVRAMLEVAGAEIEKPFIRGGFLILNLTLLTVSLVLLLDAANRMALSAAGRWILCLGLFLNPANGRLPIYYAPLGDATAFFLGTLILWGYLARRPAVVVIGFALAIVSWPAAFLLMPLLLWPRSESGPTRLSDVSSPPVRWRRIVLAAAIPLGLVLLTLLTAAVAMPPVDPWSKEVAFALATNGLQLGCAAGFALAAGLANRRLVRAWPSPFGLAAAALLMGGSVAYVKTFESGSLAFSSVTFFREILLFVRSAAFVALVGHVAYYSALAVAAVVLWPRVLRAGLALGPGAFLALALCGLIALDAESRRLNAYWPLVGFFSVTAMERLWSDRRRIVVFVVSLLALSKLWWPMNGPPLLTARHEPGNYFNTQGPSMSGEALLVNGAAAVVLALWIAHQGRKARGLAGIRRGPNNIPS